MLLWIAIFGGLTFMMGHHARSESLFYYFRLEDHVSEDHLLRQVVAVEKVDWIWNGVIGIRVPF